MDSNHVFEYVYKIYHKNVNDYNKIALFLKQAVYVNEELRNPIALRTDRLADIQSELKSSLVNKKLMHNLIDKN